MAKTVFTFDMGSPEWSIQVIMDVEGQNIHIHNSYQVTKTEDMEMILSTIMGKSFYSKMEAAGFSRSKESMLREWKAHNVLYNWNYQPNRTRSVDLDEKESAFRRLKTLYEKIERGCRGKRANYSPKHEGAFVELLNKEMEELLKNIETNEDFNKFNENMELNKNERKDNQNN